MVNDKWLTWVWVCTVVMMVAFRVISMLLFLYGNETSGGLSHTFIKEDTTAQPALRQAGYQSQEYKSKPNVSTCFG